MILTVPRLMTVAEFLEWNPENGRYELIKGVPTEMQPTGKHEEIADFLETQLKFAANRLKLSCLFPKRGLIKSPAKESGYLPDILVLDRDALSNEPLWEKYSTITQGSSVRLVVEVVSTNWRDDYVYKLTDYELLGIPEYWIIDYLGLGGKRYIGDPKQPTITVCQGVDGEYKVQLFRESDLITSSIFVDLNLTAQQIFQGK